VNKAFRNGGVEFFPGKYGQEPPDVKGANVIIVDFSYNRQTMDKIINDAVRVTILDHHKTAQADLEGIFDSEPWVFGAFDMERSGAGLAWDYFHSNRRPRLIDYIEDRDLWRFALPGSREYHAAVSSWPMTFETYDRLVEVSLNDMIDVGEDILRVHMQQVNDMIGMTKRRMVIGGHNVPVANLPVTMCSDAGNIMCKDEPFAAVYYDNSEGVRCFSLRSTDAGLDVSEIAKLYGGGGHRNASGFRAPANWEGESCK
jgi:oligoribonuclease NrnB/cAMP/cGMP phosphodiesterase (DHH superfamily)